MSFAKWFITKECSVKEIAQGGAEELVKLSKVLNCWLFFSISMPDGLLIQIMRRYEISSRKMVVYQQCSCNNTRQIVSGTDQSSVNLDCHMIDVLILYHNSDIPGKLHITLYNST